MAHLRLPAGTDVAEMALFDVDALPQERASNDSTVAALTAENHLIRFRTGADGGFLLHLFVDEPIPEHLQKFCVGDDKLFGTFRTIKGNVGFGGLESTFSGFKPNPNIRSDGTISPGEYSFTAFHTEFPDELIDQAIRVERNSGERWLSRAPVLIVLTTVLVGGLLAGAGRFLMAGLALAAGYFGVMRLCSGHAYRDLVERRKAAQIDFPSIIVELRSSASSERSL